MKLAVIAVLFFAHVSIAQANTGTQVARGKCSSSELGRAANVIHFGATDDQQVRRQSTQSTNAGNPFSAPDARAVVAYRRTLGGADAKSPKTPATAN